MFAYENKLSFNYVFIIPLDMVEKFSSGCLSPVFYIPACKHIHMLIGNCGKNDFTQTPGGGDEKSQNWKFALDCFNYFFSFFNL